MGQQINRDNTNGKLVNIFRGWLKSIKGLFIPKSEDVVMPDDGDYLGMTRMHDGRLEVHDGTDWVRLSGSIETVNTREELEAYSGKATTLVWQDKLKGGLFYYWDFDGEPDGGILFQATGIGAGLWVRSYNGFEGVDVRWFGGVPDFDRDTMSGTDNTEAFNLAIQSAHNGAQTVNVIGNYACNGEIELRQATLLKGTTTIFPEQQSHSVTYPDPIVYTPQSAIWFVGDTDGLVTTQDTVFYRNQGIRIEDLGIFGGGASQGRTGVKLTTNTNQTSPTHKNPGLVSLRGCHIYGWDIGVDATNADSFYCEKNHFSDGRIGMIGGVSDMFVDMCDFWDLTEAGYIETGKNGHISNCEFEVNDINSDNLLVKGTAEALTVINNSFKQGKTSITFETSTNANGSNIITANQFYTNYGDITINIGSNAKVDIRGNAFLSYQNTPSSATKFIVGNSCTAVVENNTFTKVSPGTVTAPITFTSSLVKIDNNNYIGFTNSEKEPILTGCTYNYFKDETFTSNNTSRHWVDVAESVESYYDLSGSDCYLRLSNTSSLFSYSGTFYIKFRTPSTFGSTLQRVVGGSLPRFYINISNSGSLSVVLGDNTINTLGTLTTNTEYELMFVYSDPNNDGAGTITPYLNGSLVSGSFNYTGYTSNPTNLDIGRLTSSEYFKGRVYDVKWFNQQFTASEVYAFLRTPNKILPYPAKLDLGKRMSSATWFDLSGNNYNVTNNGATVVRGELAKAINNTAYVDAGLALKANKAGDTYIGTHDFTGATINVPTPSPSDFSSKAAPTEYVDLADAVKVDKVGDDDIEITDPTKGLILEDTVTGTRYRIQITSGVITANALP